MPKQIEKSIHARKSVGPDLNPLNEYDSPEKREKLGIKDLTVQGFEDMLDVGKILNRMTPAQLQELAQKSKLAKYGVQSYDSVRDVFLAIQDSKQSFMELPPHIREHFKNDVFLYQEYLEKNKDNKYALAELEVDINNSPEFKRKLDEIKRLDEEKANAELRSRENLASSIAAAIQGSPKV